MFLTNTNLCEDFSERHSKSFATDENGCGIFEFGRVCALGKKIAEVKLLFRLLFCAKNDDRSFSESWNTVAQPEGTIPICG